MRRKIVIAVSIFIVLAITISLAISATVKDRKEDLYKQVRLLSDTITIVQEDYVNEVSAKDLIYGALKGMLASLDPHSQFMDPDTYSELKVETEGKFGGIGIEITIKDGLLTVVSPIEDTPAWKAGIKANDKIVKINDELTRDITLTDAVKKMRGKPGTAVNISILRESEKKILEFKIVRDIIKIKDIKEAKILEDGIGYIRLIEFRENTTKNMDIALSDLKKQGMRALILDLRNNPGGLLDAAIKVCEKFIEKDKLIVSTKGRQESQNIEFFSKNNNPLLDLPIVILINEGSASGSEIVAGALQDYKRAIILGVKSFGKGSVQTVIPLGDGSALRLTTSKYFTPLGREIHDKGLMPDVVIEEAQIQLAKKDEDLTKESVFESIEKKEKTTKEPQDLDYRSDNQLSRAVDLLKVIDIYKGIINK
jgi:carboxyl-terminal processing protease